VKRVATEIFMIKRHGMLVPCNGSDADLIESMTSGDVYRFTVEKVRNGKFHRKYFTLLEVLFNIFQPVIPEKAEKWWRGLLPVKNETRFRKDIAIATGFYELVVNIKGEVRPEAKSISFAKMDDIEFAQLYSKTIDYGLANVAKGKTREEIENWTNAILDFT